MSSTVYRQIENWSLGLVMERSLMSSINEVVDKRPNSRLKRDLRRRREDSEYRCFFQEILLWREQRNASMAEGAYEVKVFIKVENLKAFIYWWEWSRREEDKW